ncbi:MAG: HEAT repeat domain-containing protein [bacterium]
MKKQNLTGMEITSLMELLSSEDGMTRQNARKSLVVLGKPAVPFLVQTLQNSKVDHVRWEAAKALAAIGDKGDASSIPTLVNALEDRDSASRPVFWLNGREPNFYSLPVPDGEDGKLWSIRYGRGAIRLLTVPPLFARSAAELLLPREVVEKDSRQ